jgi:hypothetical protein
VAFDQAAAHYQLGEYGEAELCYRRSLEDAGGARRVRALYGLGNALAQQGQSRRGRAAVALLTDAVRQYQACLQAADAMETAELDGVRDILDNAQFNLNLINGLLDRKRSEAAEDKSPPSPGNPESSPDDSNRREGPGDSAMPGGQSYEQRPKGGNRGTPGNQIQAPPGSQPESTKDTQPGKGNLPVLSDDKDGPPLSPEQALDHLQRNLDRIRRDRANRALPPANTKGARDW